MRLFSFFLLFLFTSTFCSAQLVESVQLELPIPKRTEIEYNVVAWGDRGLILFGEADTLGDGFNEKNLYYFHKYNTNLENVWQKDYRIDDKWIFEKHFQDSTALYSLFYHYQDKKIGILQIDVEGGEFTWREATTPTDIDVRDFMVFGKNAFIMGTIKGFESLLDFSFFNNAIKVVPSFYDTKQYIQNTYIDFQNYTAYMLIKNKEISRCAFEVKSFLSDGRLLNETILQATDNKNLIDPRYLILPNGKHFVVGTYGNNCNSFAEGIAVVAIEKGKQSQRFQYTPFYFFQNYFNYLPPKRKARYDKKAKEKLAKKKDWFINQRFLVRPPIVTNNGFILLAEAYSPEYAPQNTSLVQAEINIQTGRTPTTGVLGYKFKFMLIMAFDNNGKMLWDNAVPFNDDAVNYIDFQGITKIQQDKVTVVQTFFDGYKLSAIKGDSTIYEVESVPFLKKYDNYETKDQQKEQTVRYWNPGSLDWYGDYFLIWGERLKDEKSVFSSEKVFQLTKVKFVQPASNEEDKKKKAKK